MPVFRHTRLYCLPHIGLDVAVEVGLLGDAVGQEELADICFDIGGDGTRAVAVAVIAGAGELADEVALDDALLPVGHVVTEPGETNRHATDLVAAIHGALLRLHLRIVEVDAVRHEAVLRRIVAEDRAEAVLMKRAPLAVADDILLGFLPEDLLFRWLRDCFLLFHLIAFRFVFII